MNIFENMNKLRELKKVTDKISAQEFTASSKDEKIKVIIKGDMSIKNIEIDNALLTPENGTLIKKSIVELINKALNEAKNEMKNSTQQLAKDLNLGI
jgi:DNA-binding protein YbaB